MGSGESKQVSSDKLREIGVQFIETHGQKSASALAQALRSRKFSTSTKENTTRSQVEIHECISLSIASVAHDTLVLAALGDALGLPCEGQPATETQHFWQLIEASLSPDNNNSDRSRANEAIAAQCALPWGQVSDDSQMLAVALSAIDVDSRRFDVTRFATRLVCLLLF